MVLFHCYVSSPEGNRSRIWSYPPSRSSTNWSRIYFAHSPSHGGRCCLTCRPILKNTQNLWELNIIYLIATPKKIDSMFPVSRYLDDILHLPSFPTDFSASQDADRPPPAQSKSLHLSGRLWERTALTPDESKIALAVRGLDGFVSCWSIMLIIDVYWGLWTNL